MSACQPSQGSSQPMARQPADVIQAVGAVVSQV